MASPKSWAVRYVVDPLDLPGHTVRVTTVVDRAPGAPPVLQFSLPVWTPGSYSVREYARNLRGVRATTTEGTTLAVTKETKNRWGVAAGNESRVRFEYSVYGHEPSCQGVDISPEHLYLNGAGVFCEVEGTKGLPLELEIHPPGDWKVYVELPEISRHPPLFRARDFDQLIDSPIEVGTPQVHTIRPAGVPHDLLFCGPSEMVPAHQVEEDVGKIVEATAQLFGSLPMPHYTFFYHLTEKWDGGLEHAASTSIVMPHTVFRPRKEYEGFLGVTCHEYFHLFNVKRIHPQALGPFDYSRENYTHLLWLMEGTTDYYTDLLLRRAGLFSPRHYLSELGKKIKRYRETPGRLVQSLEDSSFNSWIDFYRPNENTRNTSISYYLKGGLVSLCLDLELRHRTSNAKSLDDVMRYLWKEYGVRGVGFPEDSLPASIEKATGVLTQDFFAAYVAGTEEIDFSAFLGHAGLSASPAEKERKNSDEEEETPGYLGIESEKVREIPRVRVVIEGSPAQKAGLTPGDELLAVDGTRLTYDSLPDVLKRYSPGDVAEFTFFRRAKLQSVRVEVGKAPPEKWSIKPREGATPEEQAIAVDWLKLAWKDLTP